MLLMVCLNVHFIATLYPYIGLIETIYSEYNGSTYSNYYF